MFFSQLPVSFSSVKEKPKTASHLAFASSSAVNTVTNEFGGFVAFGFRWQMPNLQSDLTAREAVGSSGGGCTRPELVEFYLAPTIAHFGQGHWKSSPTNSENSRCFENRMLGLPVIKEERKEKRHR